MCNTSEVPDFAAATDRCLATCLPTTLCNRPREIAGDRRIRSKICVPLQLDPRFERCGTGLGCPSPDAVHSGESMDGVAPRGEESPRSATPRLSQSDGALGRKSPTKHSAESSPVRRSAPTAARGSRSDTRFKDIEARGDLKRHKPPKRRNCPDEEPRTDGASGRSKRVRTNARNPLRHSNAGLRLQRTSTAQGRVAETPPGPGDARGLRPPAGAELASQLELQAWLHQQARHAMHGVLRFPQPSVGVPVHTAHGAPPPVPHMSHTPYTSFPFGIALVPRRLPVFANAVPPFSSPAPSSVVQAAGRMYMPPNTVSYVRLSEHFEACSCVLYCELFSRCGPTTCGCASPKCSPRLHHRQRDDKQRHHINLALSLLCCRAHMYHLTCHSTLLGSMQLAQSRVKHN